jgi:hypothetical protein
MKKIMMVLSLLVFQQIANAQFVFKVNEIKKVTRTKDDWVYSPIQIKNNMEVYLDDSTVVITGDENPIVYVYGGEVEENEYESHKVKFWYAMDQNLKEIGFFLKIDKEEKVYFSFLENVTGDGVQYSCEFLRSAKDKAE